MNSRLLSFLALAPLCILALPATQPVPGETMLYSTYRGKEAPWPGNETSPIPASTHGRPGPDDLLFQNLLSAEWIVFSLYQQAVEAFNASSFTSLGYPNNTYQRITEIRDNEAGHLKVFQDSISSNSLKPGPCKYEFGFKSAVEWLSLEVLIEVSSMAFLTGLVREAQLAGSKEALLAIGATECRHNTWALIDVWNTSPFAGPVDTTYPYTEQILSVTNRFVMNGSCPRQNPVYPSPDQHLPELEFNRSTSKGHPGNAITLTFPVKRPRFHSKSSYFAVYFHGLYNVSVPFDPQTGKSTVPAVFTDQGGIILAVIADKAGAPTKQSVLAGPLFLLQQPAELTALV